MWAAAHRAIAVEIADWLGLRDNAEHLIRGSVEPDGRDQRAHHATTDGGRNGRRKIERNLPTARRYVLAGDWCRAAYHLGLTLHYVADYHIPGARTDAHAPVERRLTEGRVRAGMRLAIDALKHNPPKPGPPERLEEFLSVVPDANWGPDVLREVLLCCAATAHAVLEPRGNEQELREIGRLRAALEERLLEADGKERRRVEWAYRSACGGATPARWWEFAKWARAGYARWHTARHERRYISRAALRRQHHEAQRQLEERLVAYSGWYAIPEPPIEVAMPVSTYVLVADLAREYRIDRRRAEVMLAVHGETERELTQGVVWVPRAAVSWYCARLEEHLAACKRAGYVEELPSGKVRVICGYCGQALEIDDPGEDYVVKEDCSNRACPERFAY